MLAPVDILKPILMVLEAAGSSGKAPRPWLGTFTAEAGGRVIIPPKYRVGIWEGGPAEDAGLRAGDLIIDADDRPATSMARFLWRIWALGDAGVEAPLNIYRDGDMQTIIVQSASRTDHEKKRLH